MQNSALSKSQRRRANAKIRLQKATASNQSKLARTAVQSRSRARTSGENRSSVDNLYYQSLLYPERFPGAKIPDVTCFPSSTFQLTFDQTQAPTTGGDAVAISLFPVIGDSASFYPIIQNYGTTSGSLSSGSNVSWTQRAAVAAIYKSFRPVSAVITGEFVGSSQNDSGYAIGAILPPSTTLPTSMSTAFALPNSVSAPIRNGMRVVWRPADNSNFEYQTTTVNNIAFPIIYIAVGGLQSTAVIKWRVCVNFEGLASSDTADFLDVSPSPVDSRKLDQALAGLAYVEAASTLFNQYAGPFVVPALRAVASNVQQRMVRRRNQQGLLMA